METTSEASQDTTTTICYGPGSIAGAVIGTFFTTILLLTVAAFLYRQWRRHKGNHLVLVTDPEIVEDAYAFDNPCFKDATPATVRNHERPISTISVETPSKDSNRWSSPWSSLGLGSANKHDKRKTLDDSCLGPNATRVSIVGLRSRDFTGLGFNVCGNMREGIFVKDLLHRGPASESGRIHPGDRITSVKISFRSMVYEDALTILSYASPYDVELEVETGGTSSRPTTLLKKTVGPSPARICHPLYRSQSIPELSRTNKNSAKRLFIADPNESLGSNYSTLNSTLKSSKSTPGSQTLERRHEESKANNHHHYKFGIKVLPALDGTVHRIENQNEHNTNLERRNSRKTDVDKSLGNTKDITVIDTAPPLNNDKIIVERLRQREPPQLKMHNGVDAVDNRLTCEEEEKSVDQVVLPSEVPAEVHNAAMAARRNRKSSADMLKYDEVPSVEDRRSPLKNKRKAPAPPPASPMKETDGTSSKLNELHDDDNIESITDYTESLNDYVGKVREIIDDDSRRQRLTERPVERRISESDDDNEMQNSFTTIELNPADITIHHTPVPHIGNSMEDNDADDVYRKAASLGDLSKYEAKSLATLERAQSLDMADAGTRKRKAPLPPEDITESTEDLTKLDGIDLFDRRKLKKSNEWGTLEDAIWNKSEQNVDDVEKDNDNDDDEDKPKTRKKSNETLERSKSAVEMKSKKDMLIVDKNDECSIELYNLPLNKQLTQDFIHAERMFNPDEDNSLARIVNNGEIVKNPTTDEVELDFRQAKPLADSSDLSPTVSASFEKALRFFDLQASELPMKINGKDDSMYVGIEEVHEEPVKKITINRRCPGCEHGGHLHHDKTCELHKRSINGNSDKVTKNHVTPEDEGYFKNIESQMENVMNIKMDNNNVDEEIDDGCDVSLSVTVNSKEVSSSPGEMNRHNVSNISVSSGENSEDSGLVGESGEFNTRETDTRPPLPSTPVPIQESPRKMTYITEITVSPSREIIRDADDSGKNQPKPPRADIKVNSNGKPTTGKKPPVPPRRSDAFKGLKESSNDKQVVYVSEFHKNPDDNGRNESLDKHSNKKIDQWIFSGDNKEQNPWGNGSSQPQSVTNIVVAAGDEKIHHK